MFKKIMVHDRGLAIVKQGADGAEIALRRLGEQGFSIAIGAGKGSCQAQVEQCWQNMRGTSGVK